MQGEVKYPMKGNEDKPVVDSLNLEKKNFELNHSYVSHRQDCLELKDVSQVIIHSVSQIIPVKKRFIVNVLE